MSDVTYKDLYTLVSEEIEERIAFRSTKSYGTQTARPNSLQPLSMSGTGTADVGTQQLIRAMQTVLTESIPNRIISGLVVTASDPASAIINITAGKGTTGGSSYTLNADTTMTVPFNSSNRHFYVVLYENHLMMTPLKDDSKLTIAEIVVPLPGVTDTVVDDDNGSYDAYIIQYRTYELHGDANGHLEEDSQELLRDNMGDILAETIVGNLIVSENLSIENITGTLSLDSDSMKLKDFDKNTLARFDKDGVFFYQSNGVELAKFSTTGARIGNILITANSIQSQDFVSGSTGFRLLDTGDTEFNDLIVRGTIYATGGDIGGWSITDSMLYANPTGIIQTGADVGAGENGVKISQDGIEMYDSILGRVVYLPADGSSPQFTAGVIEQTTIEIATNSVIRTSATVGDGTANSAGILMNNTGLYGAGANQTLHNANFKILIDGSAYFKGQLQADSGTIGGFTIEDNQLSGGTIIGGLIQGSVIVNSETMPRVRIDEDGLSYEVTGSVGAYGEFLYDEALYGAGALAFLFNDAYPILTVMAQNTLADIRMFNRGAEPGSGEGPHALADMITIDGMPSYCVEVGSPGVFVPIGSIIENRTTDPDTPQTGRMWFRTDI